MTGGFVDALSCVEWAENQIRHLLIRLEAWRAIPPYTTELIEQEGGNVVRLRDVRA
jgi:hypothetical protein